jgi:hypothetical protein
MFVPHRKRWWASTACKGKALLFYMWMMFVRQWKHPYRPLRPVKGKLCLFIYGCWYLTGDTGGPPRPVRMKPYSTSSSSVVCRVLIAIYASRQRLMSTYIKYRLAENRTRLLTFWFVVI